MSAPESSAMDTDIDTPSAEELQYAKFLSNRNYTATLGPFDGVVAAVVEINGEEHLITTHVSYIPALPPMGEHNVLLRKDLRYGLDDPICWPQQYSEKYCHLGVIRTKAGSPSQSAILWWDPSPAEFIVSPDSRALALALGRLESGRLASFSGLVKELNLDYEAYVAKVPQDKIPDPLKQLVLSMRLNLERLESLPWSYEHMVQATRNLQRTCLEVAAFIDYMTVYKQYMENPSLYPGRASTALMGVYTANPQTAQQFHRAGIPYWYIRPAVRFSTENILQIVAPRPPSDIEIDPHPLYTSVVCKAGQNTDAKIAAIHQVSRCLEWYQDPFDSLPPSTSGTASASSSTARATYRSASASSSTVRATNSNVGSTGGHQSRGGGARPAHGSRGVRYSPYTAARPVKHPGRNKFEPLRDRPEMPPTIPVWEVALSSINRNHFPLGNPNPINLSYLLPEPALIASPEDPAHRQQRLHHFMRLHDALLYRLAHAPANQLLVKSQEWRDILAGKVTPQGRGKARARSEEIERLLAPTMQACGVNSYTSFPVAVTSVPPITINRAKEIIWEVAETNFRFEFLALDRRASGLYRPDECRECFPGRMLIGVPIEASTRGFASTVLTKRHPYTVRLAKLMCAWPGAPDIVREAGVERAWSDGEMRELEKKVASFYCQEFYEYFGHAAVIPIRIEHEFGM
ncbi:hypothetical protein B0H13DRAFT_2332660 [Mycena leptocephala]|nr:hypothetical protein B0H13DRAFT_2332660 [Mycena leptocephala]